MSVTTKKPSRAIHTSIYTSNGDTSNDDTPLHIAAVRGHFNYVKALI